MAEITDMRMAELAREKTHPVMVGSVQVGGGAPVSVQSMCTTKTTDAAATLAQIKTLADAGCEIIRVAIPDAHALAGFEEICQTSALPVVADIHFDHKLAIEAARLGASALRINPGNIGSWERVDAVIEAAVYLSGVGADNVNCAAAHSFYNGLTSLGGHDAYHGNCVAFGTLVQLTLEGADKAEFEDIQNFCLEVGLPITLSELGNFTDEEIHTMSKNACVEGETIHTLAGDVTPEELYCAIIATDALGKKRLGK